MARKASGKRGEAAPARAVKPAKAKKRKAAEAGEAAPAAEERPQRRKKRSKAEARKRAEDWESAGWRRVDVNDGLFGGPGNSSSPFAAMISLEELDGSRIAHRFGERPAPEAEAEPEAEPEAAAPAPKKKQKAQPKKKKAKEAKKQREEAEPKGKAAAAAKKRKAAGAAAAPAKKAKSEEDVEKAKRKARNKKRQLRRKRREQEKLAEAKGGKAAPKAAKAGGEEEEEEDVYAPREATAWDSFRLHPLVLRGIDELGFAAPTEVQRQTLEQAVHGWKDVVAAAETGSGKTLAFGIPVLQRVLAQRERCERRGMAVPKGMVALVMAPTRELALQVADHIKAVAKHASIGVATVVGGMSVAKQERLLRRRPEVVVATPGRLWELLVEGEPHLSDTSNLQCLVLDEADRMVAKGHYPELKSILKHVQRKEDDVVSQDADFEVSSEEDEDEDEDEQEEEEDSAKEEDSDKEDDGEADLSPDEDELAYYPPMPNDDDDDAAALVEELDVSKLAPPPSDDEEEEDEDEDEDEEEASEEEAAAVETLKEKVVRQVFVFSATLMLGKEGRAEKKYLKDEKRRKRHATTVLDRLGEQLEFRGAPHVVDVSSASQMATNLREQRLQCVEKEKDYYLYYLLKRLPGKKIVFCNAITCLRRLVSLFDFLQCSVHGLHAKMQQRQRLKNLDRFRAAEDGVLVCSDVAARGLDVPDVDVVIHYQLPPSSERYVHRSGRTARAGAAGRSIVMVSEKDSNEYKRLCRSLGKDAGIPAFRTDMSFVPPIAKRVNLARKVEGLAHTQGRDRQKKDWFVKNAEAMDIDLDDDLMAELGMVRDKHHDQTARREKEEAARLAALKENLKAMLAEPLVPSGVSRSYLSRNAVLPSVGADGSLDLSEIKRFGGGGGGGKKRRK